LYSVPPDTTDSAACTGGLNYFSIILDSCLFFS
jgi:hypothetical protein